MTESGFQKKSFVSKKLKANTCVIEVITCTSNYKKYN